jgi:hypothetical protein
MLLFLSLRSKPLTLLHLGNISSALMLRARRASRPRPSSVVASLQTAYAPSLGPSFFSPDAAGSARKSASLFLHVQQEIYQKRLTGFPRGCKYHYLPKPLASRSVMDWGSIRALTRKAQ